MIHQNLYYEFEYINEISENGLVDNFFNLRKQDKNFYFKEVALDSIDSLTKDSPIHLLRALYTCKPFAICKENDESFLDKKNASKILGYKSDFANIFIFNKSSLTNEYLQARKDLYKSLINLREERKQDYKEEQERISQLGYEEYQEELREKQLRDKQRQEQRTKQISFNSNKTSKDSHLILESQDKSIQIIFLDKVYSKDLENLNAQDSKPFSVSMSNLIHIHNNKIDIFTKDKTYIDIQSLLEDYQDYGITQESLNSPPTQIFFY
ncbi:hypothetical protein OQH60_08415, partial [Campylobacter sp. MIT 21-1685]|nr:hypothetical protein [Campylobacter sp. MIT 21-1684]MCX2752163.1 hypothetical protein [Campylobacter sp. MIT 21-1682]MCX2808356.1 hypothetical protein [Campylobacter sp. MIT 21-1685]